MRGRILTKSATPVVDTGGDGLLSAVNDNAVVEVDEMENISIMLNQIVPAALYTYALGTIGGGHLDTIIKTTRNGDFTLALVANAGAPNVGALTNVGTAYTFTYKGGTTTVANFESAITALAGTDLAIDTPGTGATVLVNGDAFAAVHLNTGTAHAGTFTVVVEKSVDGTNWAAVATKTEADFAVAYANDAVVITLSDANGMPLRAKQIKATMTALQVDTKLSMTASGSAIY
jgi:hypothetical protein